MRLYRIGDKVVSRQKLLDAVDAILADREDGRTQEEAAREHGVQRSFVSFLESLGEVRRGGRLAVVGFPVANVIEVRELCERHAVDFSLVLSQGERESIEAGSATEVFNMLLDTLAELRDYDVVVLIASDWRIKTMERILGTEVVGLPLESSPIREDKQVDLAELDAVLAAVTARETAEGRGRTGKVGSVRDAEKIARGVAAIKEVVSVSIGSSTRDHSVEIELLGERFRISRIGMDGSLDAAAAKFAELDGTVSAFGMGGIDIYLRADGHKYFFRDAKKLIAGVSKTPVVDGSGLKGAVEASVVPHLQKACGLDLRGKKCLMTSAVDRWGMAEALYHAGCDMVYGDLIYALDLPFPIRSWRALRTLVRTLTPLVAQLPFSFLYPVGSEQEKAPKPNPRMTKLYEWADIIAGDWQYVKKYMLDDMSGKWVITNTTTAADLELMREHGVELLVTSTPRLEGRSFGTNVIEATMVALDGADGELAPERYLELLSQVGFEPDVRWLQSERPRAAEVPASDAPAVAPSPA